MIDGHWLSSNRADPRAFALYRRHYSAKKNWAQRSPLNANFMGPGENMVLLTLDCKAVFAWQFNTTERYDHQEGVCCTIFRNEGSVLSSILIREACDLAWLRWPHKRLFTYVDGSAIRSTNPGYCFLHAGFRRAGNSKGGLTLLERLCAEPAVVLC